jgi:hypothetical protein
MTIRAVVKAGDKLNLCVYANRLCEKNHTKDIWYRGRDKSRRAEQQKLS